MISIEKQILFLLSHVLVIETRELIQIYQARNYSSQHIRNTLSYLKKNGYVTSPSRSTYSITASGRLWLNITNSKPLKYKQEWNNSWYIVMIEIPESRRKVRDLFRSELLRLGFGMLYNSVYIAPWDYTKEVIELATAHQIESNVTILNGHFLINEITPEKAWDIWKLGSVHELYLQQEAWFRQELVPAFNLLTNVSPPLDIFVLFLYLGEHLSEILLADPMLPKTILPTEWVGDVICADFNKVLKEIIELIPNNSYYSRFTAQFKNF